MVHIGHVGADLVEKVAVMRNHDNSALKIPEEIFQPFNGLAVQVVGGLIEHQDAGVAKKRLCQEHFDLFFAP